MDIDTIFMKAHVGKADKAAARCFIEHNNREEFYSYYISHTQKDILEHFNLSRDAMRLVRRIYNITDLPVRDHSSNHSCRGQKCYTNGIDLLYLKPGEKVPEGYAPGRPKFSSETCKKIGQSKKGMPHNIVYTTYTDGKEDIKLKASDIVPAGFYKKPRSSQGRKAYHNKDGKVAYFDPKSVPEGWLLFTGKKKDTSSAVSSRRKALDKFAECNNCILISDLEKQLNNFSWKNSLEINNEIKFIKYKGYRFVSNADIGLVKNYCAKTPAEHLDYLIKDYESRHNCTLMNTLVAKYGQLGIFKTLTKVKYKKYYFISNEAIPEIEEYHKISQKPYSHQEKELVAYIKGIYAGTVQENAKTEIVNPKTGRHLEIDIYLPEKQIGIEYNGIYWHSSLCGTPKDYHEVKSKLCEKAGIRLIHIYQDEWLYKTDKIKQLLNIALGKVKNIIYARSCEVRQISNKEAAPFSDKTHLQGHRDASVTYGLFYNGELVQLMSFSKTANAKRNGAEWEIIRGCPGSNNIVVGGVSRLFKHFIKDYGPSSIFSYCDFNKFNGKSYEELGMKFIGYTGPDKYWVINDHLVPRNPTRYKELKEKAQGILYGSGSKKYLWRKEAVE